SAAVAVIGGLGRDRPTGPAPNPPAVKAPDPGPAQVPDPRPPLASLTAPPKPDLTLPGPVWNEELKVLMEKSFPNGVAKGVGQQLYGVIDTALATQKDGEWRGRGGLPKDRQPLVIKVHDGKLYAPR